ncbi:EamA family transporter [Halomonas sp. B23F22_10]|uniref:EamA family transporter n=1 Tax=Halomonas sp. B23F22_10 TaxID=3459515 RepID=UPI004038E2B6
MLTGVLLGAVAGACWGLVFLSSLVLNAFSALEIAAGRFVMYGMVSLFCLLPLLRRLPRRLTLSDVALLLVLGACGNVAFFALLAASIQKVGVAPASLVVGLVPVVVTVLGRHDPGAASLRQLAWPLALVFAGVACINLDALDSAVASRNSLVDVAQGLVFAFAALASWSLFAVLNARALKTMVAVSSQQWSYLTGLASGLWALVLAVVIWGGDAARPCRGSGGRRGPGLAVVLARQRRCRHCRLAGGKRPVEWRVPASAADPDRAGVRVRTALRTALWLRVRRASPPDAGAGRHHPADHRRALDRPAARPPPGAFDRGVLTKGREAGRVRALKAGRLGAARSPRPVRAMTDRVCH